ncbi:hypothetical protein LV84_03223 [Algoriphagus ratkowskyi]|uniref:Uncharacterized protein n=1 Tax=Algoriphagus ratkowskyi TaxID=57028 RepID=A0A2W7RGS3_9BACT|nr:hypothetical protein LV84_03223 [Algoriphagus ratkowskyi]
MLKIKSGDVRISHNAGWGMSLKIGVYIPFNFFKNPYISSEMTWINN